jgi:phosphate starvation-inducible PhoH-like protein
MQETKSSLKNISLEPSSADRIALFVGELNGNLKLIEKTFSVKIFHKGDKINVTGNEKDIKHASDAILDLYNLTKKNIEISKEAVHLTIQSHLNLSLAKVGNEKANISEIQIKTPKKIIRPRGKNQQDYIKNINKYELNFGIGPAGTGKTYTGVAMAVKALKEKQVKRIILTRPAVEAGENLGFLPGDMKEKLDPYMQPLYDALRDMLPPQTLEDYILKGIIQIAPLAFMRGRTLDNAFVILDEAQNTTHSQMKMFLTRMGKNAKFMITGDPGQVDLPRRTISGLKEAILILKDVEGVGIIYLDDKDIVRHRLVKKIIDAYKSIENND